MEQLNLFAYFNYDNEEPKIILGVNKVDLSTLPEDPYRKDGKGHPYSSIIPDKYFIYKTGGYHFTDVDKKGKNDYPYITMVKDDKVKIVVPYTSWSDPYPKVGLGFNGKDGKKKTMLAKMHRLVAYAFIKQHRDPSHFVVDHIDGDVINYKIDNLRWVNFSKNNKNRVYDKNKQLELANALKKKEE